MPANSASTPADNVPLPRWKREAAAMAAAAGVVKEMTEAVAAVALAVVAAVAVTDIALTMHGAVAL